METAFFNVDGLSMTSVWSHGWETHLGATAAPGVDPLLVSIQPVSFRPVSVGIARFRSAAKTSSAEAV